MFTFKVENSPSDFQFGHFIFKFGIIDTNFKAELNLVLQNYLEFWIEQILTGWYDASVE